MNNCDLDKATIIVGSEANFDLFLTNEDGQAIDLSIYSGGNIVFSNCAGVRTVIAVPVPGLTPGAGKIAVSVPSTATVNADDKWTNADVELTHPAPALSKIVLLENKFEIKKRFNPPVVP
jgi:hypothetical protein